MRWFAGIVFGLIFMIFGRRYLWVFAALTGFLFFWDIGGLIPSMAAWDEMVRVILGLILGSALAGLALKFPQVTGILCGALVGLSLQGVADSALTMLGLTGVVNSMTVCLLLGFIACFLMTIDFEAVILLVTAVGGASQFVGGVSGVMELAPRFYFFSFLALFGFSLFAQRLVMGKSRLLDPKSKPRTGGAADTPRE